MPGHFTFNQLMIMRLSLALIVAPALMWGCDAGFGGSQDATGSGFYASGNDGGSDNGGADANDGDGGWDSDDQDRADGGDGGNSAGGFDSDGGNSAGGFDSDGGSDSGGRDGGGRDGGDSGRDGDDDDDDDDDLDFDDDGRKSGLPLTIERIKHDTDVTMRVKRKGQDEWTEVKWPKKGKKEVPNICKRSGTTEIIIMLTGGKVSAASPPHEHIQNTGGVENFVSMAFESSADCGIIFASNCVDDEIATLSCPKGILEIQGLN